MDGRGRSEVVDPRALAAESAKLVLTMATDALKLMARTGGVAEHGAKEIQLLQKMAADASKEMLQFSQAEGESLSMMSKQELIDALRAKLEELES